MGRKNKSNWFWRRRDGTPAVEFLVPLLITAAVVGLLIFALSKLY